jgi:hypothetical protein
MPEGRILQLIAGHLAVLVEQRSPKRTASAVLLRLCVVGRCGRERILLFSVKLPAARLSSLVTLLTWLAGSGVGSNRRPSLSARSSLPVQR